MEASSIAQFFAGKTILITGATGFLAKILVEKILRIQPNIKKLFLLIRATNSRSSGQRLYDEIIETDLFRVLREKRGESLGNFISETVIAVSGDIFCENLGIQDSKLRDQMRKEIDIVVNSAATTRFDERYDVALDINTFGAIHALNFAKKCLNIKMLLHVSTAFVCGESKGLIVEKAFRMGETLGGDSCLDIGVEKKLVDERLKELRAGNETAKAIRSAMTDFGLQRAKLHGWPKPYVFTKAMGEMLLEKFKEKLEVVILRPTIITSTYKEPFPGWIEGVRTVDTLAIAYGKGYLKHFLGNPESILDFIPGDMVVNSILAAIATHTNQSCDHHIYHVGSSGRNPMKYTDTLNFGYTFFTKNPWISDGGKPIIVGKIKLLDSMESFHRYMSTRYLPLLMVLHVVNILVCRYFDATYLKFKRKINSVIRLAELYKPYLFFEGIFDDNNTEKLRIMVQEGDPKSFNFDPLCIEWEDYSINVHLPGVVKYLF